ncbi:MAG: cytochrome c biogenesis protein CcsA [Proteobacteria bacterium]|jgi:ABC-type uncharacterized transport system permease subunit|nr:cytochrome c biogenesis protein CcsA [Pseudomonadota bacterium]MDA1351497.1 cytochrome c biogenesis protein CcsA [Pseudomonadota bacterium]|tara:strand:+ start:9579 stop:10373 length:795 start_codon:yes stop_codon:yes gene_type:complete
MLALVSGFTAVAIYLGGFIYLLRQLLKSPNFNPAQLKIVAAAAIAMHGFSSARLLFVTDGLDLSLLKIVALIFLVINLVVFISGQKKALHTMYLLLFPISAISLIAALSAPSTKVAEVMSPYIQGHILISILAYSLLAIAALQALLTGYQNWQLKHKQQNFLMRTFPPLQTMEKFLFDLIWAGQILLSLSLISGFLYYEDLFDQKLLHKVTLSLVAWSVYAVLLWGRHNRGWRGNKAISWSWVGFIAILMGYIGSKIALEFILV